MAYGFAFERMSRAFDAGYFIEVIAIAESVLSDQLDSHLKRTGEPVAGRRTFFDLIKAARSGAQALNTDVLDRVDKWRDARNKAIHAVVKVDESEPTGNPGRVFLDRVRVVAEQGMALAEDFRKAAAEAGH
jgi:hypothetical protein